MARTARDVARGTIQNLEEWKTKMPFDIATLAQTGAATIVSAMAADVWPAIRSRLGRLFGKGDTAQEQQALVELDEIRSAVDQTADDQTASEASIELRGILKTRLRSDQELAEAFQALVNEVAANLAIQPAATAVTQTARADHGSTVVQAGRDITTGWPQRPA